MSGFNSHLGMRPVGDEIHLATRPEHEVSPGTIHFAVLTTLAEVAAAGSVGAAVVPAQVSVNLLRRAEPGDLVARGRLVKRGRTLAIADGEVFQNERIVAKATVTFAVMA